jgi:AcrR family transcriptional regulator
MGRPQTFDQHALAARGLELVGDEGWPAVSVRSVADRLGVSSMAIYRVVPDAQALRHVIADAAAEPIQPDLEHHDVFIALEDWAGVAYRHLEQYRGLSAFVIGTWTELPHWLDIIEQHLVAAATSGLTGPKAIATVNSVFAYVLVRGQLRDSLAASRQREMAPVRFDPARYPLIRRNLREFTTAQTTKHFNAGLDALIAGLRATQPTARRR